MNRRHSCGFRACWPPFTCTRAIRRELSRHGQGSTGYDTTHDTKIEMASCARPEMTPELSGLQGCEPTGTPFLVNEVSQRFFWYRGKCSSVSPARP
jgi:hypothetical protein